jgi:hypothetical protein
MLFRTQQIRYLDLNLYSLVALKIGMSMEEIYTMPPRTIEKYGNGDFCIDDAIKTELQVMNDLSWVVASPTIIDFLRYFLSVEEPSARVEDLATYLLELSIFCTRLQDTYLPSLVAAGALYAANRILGRHYIQSHALHLETGY